MSDSQLETRMSLLAGALYLVGALLLVVTLVDYLATIWPHRPSAVEWRYGSVGLAGGFLLSPLLGLTLILMAGAWSASRSALWTTEIVGVVVAVTLVVLSALFILDGLQVRASVAEEMKGPFLFGVAKALFKLLTGAAAFFLASVAARRVRRTTLVTGSAKKGAAGTLVVGG